MWKRRTQNNGINRATQKKKHTQQERKGEKNKVRNDGKAVIQL